MDFNWNEEQQRSFREARAFAREELSNGVAERAQAGQWPERAWQRAASFGLLGLTVPERWGGLELDLRTALYVMEGVGEGCQDNGLLLSLGAQMWSVIVPLLAFATPEQLQQWLPGLREGTLVGAFALTEPQGGSDAFRLKTLARAAGSGWRLSGTKTFITNAPRADVFIVLAATAPEAGLFGLSAFLVPRKAAGLTVGPALHKMGLTTSPMAELNLEQVELGPEALLGEVGGGAAVVRHTLEWERGCLLAPAVGTMTRLLEATAAYGRERRQFGRPIVQFEAVAHQLAEMRLRRDLCRHLLYHFAWRKDVGGTAALEASEVKLYLSESLRFVAERALHLHGGYGYTCDYEYERSWRDAMASSLYSGTTEIQKNLIAEAVLQALPPEPRRQQVVA